tara:strand:- start:3352 stop:4071 length:720 start_codon:yes stop_codon:yes gene_type:complete
MKIGILSTISHPLIRYYLIKLSEKKIQNFVIFFDKKKTSLKDKNIFKERSKNYFHINQDIFKIIKKNKVKYFLVENHNGKKCFDYIKKEKINILVNCGTPRKIEKRIINSVKHGVLNVHPGILPKYKGRTCVEWSIFNNDKVGNTLHLMNENYDSGPIIKKMSYSFSKNDDYHSVRTKVYIEGVELLLNYLQKLQVCKLKKIVSHKQYKYSNNFFDVIDKKKMKFVIKLLNDGKYKYQK